MMTTIMEDDLTFPDHLKTLFDFSLTRLMKLFEIAKHTMIYFVIALFFGSIIDKIFPYETEEKAKNRSNLSLVTLIVLQMGLDAVTIFYINTIGVLFPGSKEAKNIGRVIAIAVAFIGIQPSLAIRIKELSSRLEIFPHLLDL
jgi:hypothetical protein